MKTRTFTTCFDGTKIALLGRRGFWRWNYFGRFYWFDMVYENDRKWHLYHCTADGSTRELARRYNLSECLQVAKDKYNHNAADLFGTFAIR